MTKEKQIEELTNELVFTSNYGTYNAVANYLVNKGYRKQSEGEWIEHETDWGDPYYSCSVCGDERCTIDGTIWEHSINYCPNCGAKMKGGVE